MNSIQNALPIGYTLMSENGAIVIDKEAYIIISDFKKSFKPSKNNPVIQIGWSYVASIWAKEVNVIIFEEAYKRLSIIFRSLGVILTSFEKLLEMHPDLHARQLIELEKNGFDVSKGLFVAIRSKWLKDIPIIVFHKELLDFIEQHKN